MKSEPSDIGDQIVKMKAKSGSKRFSMDDIGIDWRVFRKIFVPLYIEFMTTIENSFEVHGSLVIPGFQKIYNTVLPNDKQQITEEDPIKYVVRGSINP